MTTRGIRAETCERYRVYSTGVPLEIVAEFVDDDLQPCGYHYRKGGWIPEQGQKKTWWADGSIRTLFGYHLWLDAGCPTNLDVVLCEGETDAMALAQVLDSHLCLALAGNPSKELLNEWVITLRSMCGESGTLHFAFDNDADGDKYTERFDEAYTGKRCRLILGDYKDAAELIMAGGDLQWETLPKLSSDIVSGVDANAEMRGRGKAFEPGLTLGWSRIDHLTSGYYPGSLLMVAAPAKAGKSSLVNHMAVKFIEQHRLPVMLLPLEMSYQQVQPLLGACVLGRDLHTIDDAEVFDAVDTLAPYLYWVNHFGRITTQDVDRWFKSIRMLGVRLLIIDPIQASTAAATSDKESATTALDGIMYYISAKLLAHGISGIVVSHVNEAEPTQRISANSLRGSRALAQVPTCVLGVQRLDGGASKVYVITPDRRYGRYGEVSMVYEGHQFHETVSKAEAML